MVSHPSPSYDPSQKETLEKRVFHNPDPIEAGKNLIGLSLFTHIDGHVTGGIILETESYVGVEDKASHAYGGRRTHRTEVMYRKGGVAYVYLCYGIHTLFNVVTGEEGVPHAILIRALHPTHGIDLMMQRRGHNRHDAMLAKGPGSLAKALGISVAHTGTPLHSEWLWIADCGGGISQIETTPRIGVGYAKEWALRPLRFVARMG